MESFPKFEEDIGCEGYPLVGGPPDAAGRPRIATLPSTMISDPDPTTDVAAPDTGGAAGGRDGLPATDSVLLPGHLTIGWRWVLAIGWALSVPVLITLADAANTYGKPTWWLSATAMPNGWTPVPFVAPLMVTMAATANWRRWPLAALAGVLGLGLTALFDRTRSPSVALGEAILAAAALLTSVACLAGRIRPTRAQ